MSTAERQRTSARRDSLLGDLPGAFATARYVRITPMKARRVVDLVRGMPVDQALATLQFAPQAASETVYKVLESAVANAETTEGLERHGLVISVAQVDEGPTMKRWRPRAQGRATRINKRTSHITLVVQPADVAAPRSERQAKKTAAKTSPAKTSSAKASAAETSAPAKKTAKKAPAKKAAKKATAKASAKKTAPKKSDAAKKPAKTTETNGESA